ncbi:MAG: hypothetical protein HKN26_08510 [Acidimicrobiales bacterium]|nr:hypothetical protein [Acidimicrobiales bacterium]
MELTLPPGTLTDGFRTDVDAFYADVLGWQNKMVPILGTHGYLMQPDSGQFILLLESDDHMQSPGYDHLGLLADSRAEVDRIMAECQAFAEQDDRMQLKFYDDLVSPSVTVHAFYVRYLLPIWFDVQSMERPPGQGPERSWQFVSSSP